MHMNMFFFLFFYIFNMSPWGILSHSEFLSCHCPEWILCSLIWSVKIYKPHCLLLFSIFCHIVLTSIQLKYTTALCLTLHCHFVWLINLHASQAPCKNHHLLSTTVGTTPALATPTQLSDQTQLHVPFISAGAAWPCGSSVNLWSQSIIYSPTRPRALHCH